MSLPGDNSIRVGVSSGIGFYKQDQHMQPLRKASFTYQEILQMLVMVLSGFQNTQSEVQTVWISFES